MGMSLLLMMLVFLALLVIGVHIGLALGLTSTLYILLFTDFDVSFIAQAFVNYVDSFTLMAIPFFILAGYMMEKTAIIKRIFAFFKSITASISAGLGVASMFTCMMFAAITGSSVAEASAMSVIAIPEMKKEGYSDAFAAGIIATGGSLGMLIPPSLTMILFGIIAEQSIPALFMAGMIPGLILGTLLSIAIAVHGYMIGYRGTTTNFTAVRQTAGAGFWALMLPVVVLGGLYGGIFTPTEAGAVACAYALVYGIINDRVKFIRSIPEILKGSAKMSGMVFLLLGGAGIFGLVLTVEQIPQMMTEAILKIDMSWWMFLIIYNILLIIMGMFVDAVTLIVLTLPIVWPIASALGINPWHLAVVITINTELAVITPPVGLNLYAISGISKIPIERVVRGALPFMLVILFFLLVCTFFPVISTYLPTIIFGPWQPTVY